MIHMFEGIEGIVIAECDGTREGSDAELAAAEHHWFFKSESSRADASSNDLAGSDERRNESLVSRQDCSRRFNDAVELGILRVGLNHGRLSNQEDLLEQTARARIVDMKDEA